MGAERFRNLVKGDTPEKAFSDAVDKAAYDYGHSGYTGTIAEKPSFEMRNDGKSLTRKEAYAFSKEDGSENEKWEPAFCVPVKADDSEEIVGYLFYGWASS